MKMFTHPKRKMGGKVIPIIQQAIDEDSELLIEAQAQITAAVYAMCKAIVQFDTKLRNVPYFEIGQRKRMADTEGARRKWVRNV
jgi:hypothetical protein